MTLWAIVGVVLALILACEYMAWKTGVPTVTSYPSVRKKMVEVLKQEAARRGADKPFTVIDLGSGTGKLALEIGRALPQVRVTGVEISRVPYLFSRLRRFLWRAKNVTFRCVDFWPYDISCVDAVVIFINDKIRQRLADKLKQELPPGALVISSETHLPGWEPVDVYGVGLLKLKVVVYRQGA